MGKSVNLGGKENKRKGRKGRMKTKEKDIPRNNNRRSRRKVKEETSEVAKEGKMVRTGRKIERTVEEEKEEGRNYATLRKRYLGEKDKGKEERENMEGGSKRGKRRGQRRKNGRESAEQFNKKPADATRWEDDRPTFQRVHGKLGKSLKTNARDSPMAWQVLREEREKRKNINSKRVKQTSDRLATKCHAIPEKNACIIKVGRWVSLGRLINLE